MSLAHRIGIALAIAGSVLTLAAAPRRVFSPGYTYRLRIDGRVVDPDGKKSDFVVLSGRAMVSKNGGRLDIEEASKERGVLADKGGYLLYDPTSMMIVSPKDKQILKFAFESLEQGMSAFAANVRAMRMKVSDVAVSLDELGAGPPMLGMATRKYRITQDYELAVTMASVDRSSTEHVVEELWIADEKPGFANPFVRMGQVPVGGGSAFDELLTKTAEAERAMGRGIPLKTVTSTTSMLSRNEVTRSVSTMQVTELKTADIDDALLTAPADYRVTDVGEQMKAMAAEQARAAQNAQDTQAAAPASGDSAASATTATKPAAKPTAKPAGRPAAQQGATDAAAAEAKQGMVKALHGMIRRP